MMGTSITVRDAARNDLDDLARLCVDVHELHVRQHPWRFRSLERAAAREQFAARLADPNHRCLVAECSEAVVGYILLILRDYPENPFSLARRSLDIDQIAVEASQRGRGIGDVLMAAAKALARSEGIARLELSVWAFNQRARRFFSKHGFEVAFERRVSQVF